MSKLDGILGPHSNVSRPVRERIKALILETVGALPELDYEAVMSKLEQDVKGLHPNSSAYAEKMPIACVNAGRQVGRYEVISEIHKKVEEL